MTNDECRMTNETKPTRQILNRHSSFTNRHSAWRVLRHALCLLPLLLACQRPHPVGPLILGQSFWESYSGEPDDFYQWVLVYDVDGLARIPLVKVNDVPIDMTYYEPQQGQYESWNPFPVDTTLDVKIAGYDGEAHCRVNMPGSTQLTLPTPWFVLQKDQPVTIAC